jgi:hypothetical protein
LSAAFVDADALAEAFADAVAVVSAGFVFLGASSGFFAASTVVVAMACGSEKWVDRQGVGRGAR